MVSFTTTTAKLIGAFADLAKTILRPYKAITGNVLTKHHYHLIRRLRKYGYDYVGKDMNWRDWRAEVENSPISTDYDGSNQDLFKSVDDFNEEM